MDEPLLLSRDHQILGEPETKQPVAQHHAWSLTTLAQTLGCRIPLVRTVILGYRSLT
jgi:hypothetical protein